MTKNEIIENYFGLKLYAEDIEQCMNDPSTTPHVAESARRMYESVTKRIADREVKYPWLLEVKAFVEGIK